MSASATPPDSPYRVIAASIRARIATGELRPGQRAPSIRQIAQRWGVAIATATKVTAMLRDEGLIETRIGSGAVVCAPRGAEQPGRTAAAGEAVARRSGPSESGPHRELLVRSAVAIADTEGLEAVSMRRLAADLGTGPMSLYRHVANKEELLALMADAIFRNLDLPEPGTRGWRADLELIARAQWQLCHRHLWLPRVVSFTRPMLTPKMLAQTEWTLVALDGFGLSPETRMREALALHSLVMAAALTMAYEKEAEQNTGLTHDGWRAEQRDRAERLLGSGEFPHLAAVPLDTATDLEAMFEYSLARHLDGFATLVASSSQAPADTGRRTISTGLDWR